MFKETLTEQIHSVNTRFSGGVNYLEVNLIMLVFELSRVPSDYSIATQSLDMSLKTFPISLMLLTYAPEICLPL